MQHWTEQAIFYHIYPLGFCGAPEVNDFTSPAQDRLDKVHHWLDHIQRLGANALYLGPVFESTRHGYDTADYYCVDRRLGTNEALAELSEEIHRRGMRLALDGVFNHVGRDFWAFRDLQTNHERSAYRDWFADVDFSKKSSFGDPFSYEGWNGHSSLVKLNQDNSEVREHLFGAVEQWMQKYQIDGLRLDAADCLTSGFMQALAAFCRKMRPDFWLMGEVIHGDYTLWANPSMLDSVTNYECYKGLYSSHFDRNYFEIAYALNRQSGDDGLYRGLRLYNFADNHDVNRVASNLQDQAHLYPLYTLLFTMPGIPSVYYGSEWGLTGVRSNGSDKALRPQLDLATLEKSAPQPGLPNAIARFAEIRKSSPALSTGSYRQLFVASEQLVYSREYGEECIIVALNSSRKPAKVTFRNPYRRDARLLDLLNPADHFDIRGEACTIELPPCWARIMRIL